MTPLSESHGQSPARTEPPAVQRLRHPEKAHRPDSPIQRKPDWIRAKAPVSAEAGEIDG